MDAAEPALPGRWRGAPLRGLRPDTNGVPFVPAEGQGLWPCAACKDAEGASEVGQLLQPPSITWVVPVVKPLSSLAR